MPTLEPRLAAGLLRLSGVVGAVGAVFLVLMYAAFAAGARTAGLTLGWINDVSAIVTLPLALPGVLALHARLRPTAGPSSDALLLLGIGAGGSIVVLQVLLVSGVVTFEQQIVPVSIAFIVIGLWFILYGRATDRAGLTRRGTRLGVAGATYFGYPLWAFGLAREVETASAASSTPTAA
jgi:hypothetical protein